MALKDESWVRSLLISLGAFWLSLQVAIPLAYLFGKLTSGIIYIDSIFNTIAMGVMTSMGRAVAAALAAAIVTLSAASQKPERWAFLVAILYLAKSPTMHWHLPPTTSDRLWQGAGVLWLALACIAVAIVTARLRRKWGDAGSKKVLWIIAVALVATVVCSVVWPQVILHSNATH
jgi:hypothetical protein